MGLGLRGGGGFRVFFGTLGLKEPKTLKPYKPFGGT